MANGEPLNGRVRKKSNDNADEADVDVARRFPKMATAAMTATRMSAAAVPANDARAGKGGATPSGTTHRRRWRERPF